MKLAEMKTKVAEILKAQRDLRASAKAIIDAAGASPSAEDLKNITAKHDEAGKFASELSVYQNLIKFEEEGTAPPGTGRGNQLSELDLTGNTFSEVTRRVSRMYDNPRFVKCDGNVLAAKKLCYEMGVWAATLTRDCPKWARDRAKELFQPEAIHQEDGMTSGSALVPPQFMPELIRLIELFGVARANSRVVPMTSDVLNWPRRTAGLSYYWVGEGQTGTTSTMVIDLVRLVAKKLMVLCVATRELFEDSAISLGDLLFAEMAYQMSSAEDDALFLGDGTSAYGGITGIGNKLLSLSGTISQIAGIQVATGTGSWAGTVLSDFNAFIGLLPNYADMGNNAKIYTNRSYFYTVMQRLATAAGGVTATEVIDGIKRPMFLGYPVVYTQKLPRFWAVSQFVAYFGDLALASKFGDRRKIEFSETADATIDSTSMFTNDMRGFRATERIDIVVHDVGNASATASAKLPGPIVGLQTATS